MNIRYLERRQTTSAKQVRRTLWFGLCRHRVMPRSPFTSPAVPFDAPFTLRLPMGSTDSLKLPVSGIELRPPSTTAAKTKADKKVSPATGGSQRATSLTHAPRKTSATVTERVISMPVTSLETRRIQRAPPTVTSVLDPVTDRPREDKQISLASFAVLKHFDIENNTTLVDQNGRPRTPGYARLARLQHVSQIVRARGMRPSGVVYED